MKVTSNGASALLVAITLVTVLPSISLASEEEVVAAPVFMSPEWAEIACEAWNEDPVLTTELLVWLANDLDRGFKIIQMYRMDCEESDHVELRLALEERQTRCVYGGADQGEELQPKADYVMFALTERWMEMGAGKYGPMKGMFTRRLRFEGPKWEAMKNMGPFSNFLQLAGGVPGDIEVCP